MIKMFIDKDNNTKLNKTDQELKNYLVMTK